MTLQGHEMDAAVTHALERYELLCAYLDRSDRPAQHHRLHEVGVQARDHQVLVFVL